MKLLLYMVMSLSWSLQALVCAAMARSYTIGHACMWSQLRHRINIAASIYVSAFVSLEEDATPSFLTLLQGKLEIVGLESQDAVVARVSVSVSCMTAHAFDAVLRRVAASYRS
jgi:hypothetical protein